jgi:hypothetical protein
MKVSQCQNKIASYLPFLLCLSVPPSVAALRTLVVLSAPLLGISKLFERKKEPDKTFGDASGVLTITRVAL